MILNVPAKKEDVEQTRIRYMTDAMFRREFTERFRELSLSRPKRCTWNLNTEDCSGDYLQNAKSATHCFSSMDLEDCMYVFNTIDMENCMDTTRGSFSRNLYECKATSDLSDTCFSNLTYQCDNLLYCDNAHGSKNCFGCFGIKNARYCILNMQYSKKEYEELVPIIVKHMRASPLRLPDGSHGGQEWGEFFPTTLSSFAYNETKAFELVPLSKDEALKRGWGWKDDENNLPALTTIDVQGLPQNIEDVPDEILEAILSSDGSGKPYRIIPQELALYRKRNLPLPHLHPYDRLQQIASRENPQTLYNRSCAKCQKDMQTTYAPNRPEIVYCESCYLETVY